MNLKKVTTRLAFVSMLTMILAVTLASASDYHNWLDPGPGSHVDSHWWDITIDDELRLERALACELDLIGAPYPEAIDDLMAAGFTMTTMQSDGYTMLFENNRVWPTGGPDATGHPESRSTNFRKGLHRLVPKADYVALFAPLNSACEWWAPPIQAYWINPAAPAPTYNPVAACAFLDAGGFTEDPTLGTNPYYDSEYAWSAQYLRKDPVMGGAVAFEYYAIGPVEAPIGFEGAQLITEHWRMAGLTVDLVAGTWLGLVFRLTNADLCDYQVMTGVGVTNQGIGPDFMYDHSYSENLPLWNWAGQNNSAMDAAGLILMGTLFVDECRAAAYTLQSLFCQYEPFMPLLLWENFIATKGPSRESYPLGDITWPAEGTHPGLIGLVVDRRGGVHVSSNVYGKQLCRGDRYDMAEYPNEERNIWGTGAYLDTLNPLMADTVPDWQTLANIMDGFYGRNPYTMDYQWWGAKGAPDVKPWPGPGRKQIGGNGVYDAEFTGTHYDGIPMAELTVDDMVGDDILGMVTTWEMRPGIYWHDSDPGPNGKFEEIGDPDYDDGEKHGLTAEDIVFGLNLIRDQECDRYQTQWWFIYAVEKINDYKFAVYEERQYVFAFQDHGVGCYVPKHIWEGYINPTYDIGSLPITRLDGTTGYGDEIIGWEHHHEEWAPWEEVHIQDPSIRDPVTGAISDDPRFRLTKLIGFGPFKYHIDGWIVGDSSHFEGNRQYFGHCVCDGDVDFDQITMLPDMNKVMRSVGEYRLDPNYDVAADICYPAQVIDVSEIYAVQSHWAHYWGPAPLRSGFTWCDCHTGE